MKIFCSANISELNYWLLICIAKNNFKDDFLDIQMFSHPQIPDFQILSKPYINGNIIDSAFRWCINLNFEKLSIRLVLWSRVTFTLSINIKATVEYVCLVWSPSHWLRYQLLCEISPVAWMKWRMAPSLGLCISGSICWWLKEPLQSHSIVQSAVHTPTTQPKTYRLRSWS